MTSDAFKTFFGITTFPSPGPFIDEGSPVL
jgi:hypothetical protein